MEKKLRILFDYQRFCQNQCLSELIEKTERKYTNELSDDDIALVNAAGEAIPDERQKASESEDPGNA